MKPKVMLAKNYDNEDPAGWLVSEKLDGVRAIWTGTELTSRNGNKFSTPNWFTTNLPKSLSLDGELYLGRGEFQKTVSIVRKLYSIEEEWKNISYYIFDVIEDLPYEERMKKIPSGLKVLSWKVIKNNQHFNSYFNDLLTKGAEGVMLRNPKTPYEFKRTKNLLKYKPIYLNEAEVIAYQEGEGKYTSLIGALICKWGNKVITIGSGLTDQQRANPPMVGSIISFKYYGLTNSDMPRHPVFLTERDYE